MSKKKVTKSVSQLGGLTIGEINHYYYHDPSRANRQRSNRLKVFALILGLIASSVTIYAFMEPRVMGDTYKVSSKNQSGGITAAKVDISIQPEWRNLADRPAELRAINSIVDANPGKPVRFMVQGGDTEAKAYAIQIQEAMRFAGIEVEDFISDGFGGEPMPPLSYRFEQVEDREWVLIQVGNQFSQTKPTGKPPG